MLKPTKAASDLVQVEIKSNKNITKNMRRVRSISNIEKKEKVTPTSIENIDNISFEDYYNKHGALEHKTMFKEVCSIST